MIWSLRYSRKIAEGYVRGRLFTEGRPHKIAEGYVRGRLFTEGRPHKIAEGYV
jgi:hypothetical protein